MILMTPHILKSVKIVRLYSLPKNKTYLLQYLSTYTLKNHQLPILDIRMETDRFQPSS